MDREFVLLGNLKSKDIAFWGNSKEDRVATINKEIDKKPPKKEN